MLSQYAYGQREFAEIVMNDLATDLRNNPQSLPSHIAAGEMLIYMKRYSEALNVFLLAQKKFPSSRAVSKNLSILGSM